MVAAGAGSRGWDHDASGDRLRRAKTLETMGMVEASGALTLYGQVGDITSKGPWSSWRGVDLTFLLMAVLLISPQSRRRKGNKM